MKRFMLTMGRLRDLQPDACASDVRVAIDVDTLQLSLVYADADADATPVPLKLCGTRELRLLARQLEWFAAHIDQQHEADFEAAP